MLVLSRKVGEKIMLGDNITITVVKVHGNNIRIGIDAPPELRVLRAELQTADPATPADPVVETPLSETQPR